MKLRGVLRQFLTTALRALVITSFVSSATLALQGGLLPTGIATDLAVNGEGWFLLRDPDTGLQMVTRRCDAQLDAFGFLTVNGNRLQGYADPGLASFGDLKIDDTGRPPSADPQAALTSFRFRPDGSIVVHLDDGTEYVRGQVLLQNFSAPANLVRIERHLYLSVAAAGPLSPPSAPGTAPLGQLLSGQLETEPEPLQLTALGTLERSGALSEGALTWTGRPTDLALRGSGLFLVRATNSNERFVTRAGLFVMDRDGYLVTYGGRRLQGLDDDDTDGVTTVDVQVDGQHRPPTSDPAAVMASFRISRDGAVWVALTDGTEYRRSRILVWKAARPGELFKTNDSLHGGVDKAGLTILEPPGPATPGPLWFLHQGALELINADEASLHTRRQWSWFTQGPLQQTGVATDVALSGRGFLVLRDPLNGTLLVTRNGRLQVDVAGYLTSAASASLRVQGFTNAALTQIGDIRVDAHDRPPGTEGDAALESFAFDTEGHLLVTLSEGTQFVRAQILLQDFRESYRLQPAGAGSSFYTNLAAAVPLIEPGPPLSSGLGHIQAGALEIPTPAEVLSPPARDGFRLRFTGEPGSRFTIQSGDLLGNWQDIGPVELSSDEAEWSDFTAPGSSRFYRARIEPR